MHPDIQSHSQTKNPGHWCGSETSAHTQLQVVARDRNITSCELVNFFI